MQKVRYLAVALVLALFGSLSTAETAEAVVYKFDGYDVQVKWSGQDGVARLQYATQIGPYQFGAGKDFSTEADARRAAFKAATEFAMNLQAIFGVFRTTGTPVDNIGVNSQPRWLVLPDPTPTTIPSSSLRGKR